MFQRKTQVGYGRGTKKCFKTILTFLQLFLRTSCWGLQYVYLCFSFSRFSSLGFILNLNGFDLLKNCFFSHRTLHPIDSQTLFVRVFSYFFFIRWIFTLLMLLTLIRRVKSGAESSFRKHHVNLPQRLKLWNCFMHKIKENNFSVISLRILCINIVIWN